LLVGLSTRGANCGTLPRIEGPELDARGIYHFAHLAAEGVNLPNQVTLGQAADGWITGHERNRVKINGQQQRTATHARPGQGRFAPGMPGPPQ
jgi:hypothetical protein